MDDLKNHLVPSSFAPGQVVSAPGDRADRVYFPVSGLVSAFALFETGQQVECVLIGRSGAIGALAALGMSRGLTLNVSHFHTHAWSIAAETLHQMCLRSPGVAEALTRACEAQIGYGVRVGACNAVHNVEQRLARWLLCASALLEDREIQLPQEAFAQVLGAQRSTVNPLLQRFQAEGMIKLKRANVEVVDHARLQRRACECYRTLSATLR